MLQCWLLGTNLRQLMFIKVATRLFLCAFSNLFFNKGLLLGALFNWEDRKKICLSSCAIATKSLWPSKKTLSISNLESSRCWCDLKNYVKCWLHHQLHFASGYQQLSTWNCNYVMSILLKDIKVRRIQVLNIRFSSHAI